MGGLLENGVPLVTKAATGDDGGQVVAGVIGGVSETAADYHGGVVEQGAVAFPDLIEIGEKLIEVLEKVDLDATEVGDLVGLSAVVRKRVPTTGGAGHLDGPIDPVHRESDDPGGVGLEGELGQFEQVLHLGREGEFAVVAERVRDLGLAGIEPEFLVLELGLQFSDDAAIGINLGPVAAPALQLFHVPVKGTNDFLVVGDALTLGGQVFLAKELVEDLRFVVKRRDGDATVVPRAPPTTIVDAEWKKGKAGVASDVFGEDLVDGNAVGEVRCFRFRRAGEKGFLRVMIARVHARVVEVLEDGHLLQRLHSGQVAGAAEVAARLGKEVRFVETQRIADKQDSLGRLAGFRRFRSTQGQRLQGQGKGSSEFEDVSAAGGVHGWASVRAKMSTSMVKSLRPQ